MTSTGQENLLRQLLDKIQRLEDGINQQLPILSEENKNRAKEIQNLGEQLKMVALTEVGSGHLPDDLGEKEMHAAQVSIEPNEMMKATEAIRTIETLRERDDVGVEDFIKSVRINIKAQSLEATRTYILNLRREIGILVIPSKPRHLIEAQTMAADMELWTRDANHTMERRQINTKHSPLRPTTQRPTLPAYHVNPPADRTSLKCTKCNKIGHTSDKCYVRNFQMGNQGKIPSLQIHNTVTEVETYELTAPPEDCYELDANYQTNQTSTKIFFMGNDKHTSNLTTTIHAQNVSHTFYVIPDDFPLIEVENNRTNTTTKNCKKTNSVSRREACSNMLHQYCYKPPEYHKQEIERQINKMLEKSIIEPSDSPYNAPVWVVPKKPDASGKRKWRIVIDFRKLNQLTDQDAYPLPTSNEILDHLGKAKFFSALDLSSGFHQIPMNPNSKKYTAFSTPQSHFHYNRMPFGLKNAPATFQRMIDIALRGLIGKHCFVYHDDIIIFGSTIQEHNQNLAIVLHKLQDLKLKLQPDKCEFLKPELECLGHIVTADGVKPNPKKLEAIENFKIPKTPTHVKSFLGLTGYYRKFIRNFSKIAKPLIDLTKKDTPFHWTDKQQLAFNTLKQKLCESPVLQYSDYDKPFTLTTDASNEGLGAILSQDGHPCCYISRTLNPPEKNYSTTEKERLYGLSNASDNIC
nr:PREDICTED: uncharacterized protein LOC105664165 [Megachile rotundata]